MAINEKAGNIKRAEGITKNRALVGPEIAQITAVRKCNQSCKYCWIYSDVANRYCKLYNNFYMKFRKNQDFPISKFKEVVDDLAEIGTPTLSISGDGEPFMHKNLGEMVRYAHEKGLSVGIQTNGTISLENFKEIGMISFLNIHVPSLNEKNSRLLQASGISYLDRVIRNIQWISRMAEHRTMPKIELGLVVNKINCNEIIDFFDFALKYNIDSVCLKKLRSFNHVDELCLDKGDIEKIRDSVKFLLGSGKSRKVKNNLAAFLKELNTEESRKRQKCLVGYYRVYINLDGSTSLCCWNPFRSFGNVFKKRLKDIWFSKKADNLRGKMQSINTAKVLWRTCRTCPLSTVDLNKKLCNISEYFSS
ncbi:MAG: radical SAM protein [archaeon]